ncbi:MAG: hypothetical protein CL424_03955 [Acidimicrobiaceae bacterium]|nr:hypothetical protein [Acidimicrobiaceae bacterium]
MHPIEHLRYVARAGGGDPAGLAREAAFALGSLRADPANLVVASRRLIERHPDAGAMWWLCAQLLVSDDPSTLAWELADRLMDDPVVDRLVTAIPADATIVTVGYPPAVAESLVDRTDLLVRCADTEFRAGDLVRRLDRAAVAAEPITHDELARAVAEADLVLIEATAACDRRVLATLGSQVVAATATSAGTPVWLVVPTGTRIPHQYVTEVARRSIPDDDGWRASVDDLPLDLIDVVVNADGRTTEVAVALRPDCPFAPELLRTGIV